MTENNIQHLINKYNQPYIPGEKHTKEYNQQIQTQTKHKNRLQILEQLNNELPYHLKINKDEKKIIQTILKTFKNNIKYLHRQLTEEQIILCLIFIIKKRVHPELKLNNKKWPIFNKKYNIRYPELTTVTCRLLYYYLLHNPHLIHEVTTQYDHEILMKNNTIIR